MIKLTKFLLVAGCVAALSFTTTKVQAQGRGNFDPTQFRQRMVDNFKDRMGVTNDDEWKVLEAAIGKVVDAQMEVRAGSIRAFGGGGQRRNRGGNNGDTNNAGNQTQGNRPPGFGTPSPEADDLQKAIEDKSASKDDINAKLAKLREANAAGEAKLASAQDDLKKLLTARQEAVAVLYGLLK
jgi:hypothetical protein